MLKLSSVGLNPFTFKKKVPLYGFDFDLSDSLFCLEIFTGIQSV